MTSVQNYLAALPNAWWRGEANNSQKGSMPTGKLRELCAKIAEEKDSVKLNSLVEQLLQLLDNQQEEIRSQIRAQILKLGHAAGE